MTPVITLAAQLVQLRETLVAEQEKVGREMRGLNTILWDGARGLARARLAENRATEVRRTGEAEAMAARQREEAEDMAARQREEADAMAARQREEADAMAARHRQEDEATRAKRGVESRLLDDGFKTLDALTTHYNRLAGALAAVDLAFPIPQGGDKSVQAAAITGALRLIYELNERVQAQRVDDPLYHVVVELLKALEATA